MNNEKNEKDEKNEKRDLIILDFLNKAHIGCTTLNELHGLLLPRELFFNDAVYKQLKTTAIPELKHFFSSSYLTALQGSAETQQRWPLLNLIRQVLRSCSFKLSPKRVSDGYTADGKKKYKRMFIIERMKLGDELLPQI
jgi:hypothetical protein